MINEKIKEVAKEWGATVEFLEIANPNNFEDIENNCSVAGKEIFVGIYDRPEEKLISVFHEIGHMEIGQDFIKKWKYNTLMIEIECWNIGIRIAKDIFGITFTDKAIEFAYKKALSYVGHDEREVSNWKSDAFISMEFK